MDLERIHRFAADNFGLVGRANVLDAGGSDDAIQRRLDNGTCEGCSPAYT